MLENRARAQRGHGNSRFAAKRTIFGLPSIEQETDAAVHTAVDLLVQRFGRALRMKIGRHQAETNKQGGGLSVSEHLGLEFDFGGGDWNVCSQDDQEQTE